MKKTPRRFTLEMPDKIYVRLRKEAFKAEESVGETVRRLLLEMLDRKAKERDKHTS